jgi:hypothetical protein
LRRNTDSDVKAVALLLRLVSDAGALPGHLELSDPQIGD